MHEKSNSILNSGMFFIILFKVLRLLVSFIHSFIPLACTEVNDSLPFSGASSIPLCYVLYPATLPHQPFFHSLSTHLAIYFFVYLSILLFPNSYIIFFWEFYFLSFSVYIQTNLLVCYQKL